MDLSIVIPLYNESESLNELNQAIINSLNGKNLDFEIIYIDDGRQIIPGLLLMIYLSIIVYVDLSFKEIMENLWHS